MRKTTALMITLILSHIAWFGAWLYRSLDMGVTIAYQQDRIDTTASSLQQALSLAQHNLIGKSAEDAKREIPRDLHDAEPYVKEGCLYYGQICLELNQDQVITEIKAFSSYERYLSKESPSPNFNNRGAPVSGKRITW